MRRQAHATMIALVMAVVTAGCAAGSPSPALLPDEAPWWETAGPCRVWVPVQPVPSGHPPAWDPGPSTTRMSNPGDCRALQAGLPDGAVLIGSPSDKAR